MKKFWAFLALFTLLSSWARGESEPSNQVWGYYSKGHLQNSSHLPTDGTGFLHLFLERNRGYGSLGVIELIETVSAEMWKRHPDGERLQIGDIAAENGGVLTMHASHQNGLDVDIVYFRLNHHEQQPSEGPQMVEIFVDHGKVSKNFDLERNWELLQLIVDSQRINRIFMDPAIKAGLCAYVKNEGMDEHSTQVLGHVQPYVGHDTHMHVRMTCPKDSPGCLSQPPLPVGSGCT